MTLKKQLPETLAPAQETVVHLLFNNTASFHYPMNLCSVNASFDEHKTMEHAEEYM